MVLPAELSVEASSSEKTIGTLGTHAEFRMPSVSSIAALPDPVPMGIRGVSAAGMPQLPGVKAVMLSGKLRFGLAKFPQLIERLIVSGTPGVVTTTDGGLSV